MCAIVVRPIPGRFTRENLLKYLNQFGFVETSLRPLRKRGNTSSEDEVIECSEKELEVMKGIGSFTEDFVAFREDTLGRLTQIYPKPLKVVRGRKPSKAQKTKKVADLLRHPGITTARNLPPPKSSKSSHVS